MSKTTFWHKEKQSFYFLFLVLFFFSYASYAQTKNSGNNDLVTTNDCLGFFLSDATTSINPIYKPATFGSFVGFDNAINLAVGGNLIIDIFPNYLIEYQ